MSDWPMAVRAEQFLYEYAACLDEERFDTWVAMFNPVDCAYEVQSRENRDLGLPLPIMGCYTHGMIHDRVAMLAKGVLTFRRYHLLRQVSNVRVRRIDAGSLLVNAGLVVHQSSEEGVPSLYMVARYEARLIDSGEAFLISRMAVVVDSFGIDTMLAVPL